MADKCRLDTLVSTKTCEVQFCECCGLFHLTLGPLTLRLKQAHFMELLSDLNMAVTQQKRYKAANISNVRKLHS